MPGLIYSKDIFNFFNFPSLATNRDMVAGKSEIFAQHRQMPRCLRRGCLLKVPISLDCSGNR